MGPWFAYHFKCNINHRIILQRNLSTYHGLGTPNSPGQTASTYQVRIPYNTESTNSIPMAPANEYRSPVPSNGLVQMLCQFAPLSYKKTIYSLNWFHEKYCSIGNISSISAQKIYFLKLPSPDSSEWAKYWQPNPKATLDNKLYKFI